MDWTNIIIAALGLIGSLLGVYFANRKSAALIAYRIEELENRVDKHNNLVERMYRVEAKLQRLEAADDR